jgi:hypothetical protein
LGPDDFGVASRGESTFFVGPAIDLTGRERLIAAFIEIISLATTRKIDKQH